MPVLPGWSGSARRELSPLPSTARECSCPPTLRTTKRTGPGVSVPPIWKSVPVIPTTPCRVPSGATAGTFGAGEAAAGSSVSSGFSRRQPAGGGGPPRGREDESGGGEDPRREQDDRDVERADHRPQAYDEAGADLKAKLLISNLALVKWKTPGKVTRKFVPWPGCRARAPSRALASAITLPSSS